MHASTLGRSKDVLAFGPFTLDSDDLLRVSDERVHLFPKQMEALRYLASRNGRVVSKDELLSQVWRDAFVGEGSLHHCISTIRKQLGKASGGVHVIETVAKRGYRFTLPVTVVGATAATKSADASPLRIGILHFECGAAIGLNDVADRLASRVASLLSHLRCIGLEVTNQAALNRLSPDPLEAAQKLGLSVLVTGRVFKDADLGFGTEVEILRSPDQTIIASRIVTCSRAELHGKVASCIMRHLPLLESGTDHDEIAAAVEGGEECFQLYLEGLSHARSMVSTSLETRRTEDLRLAIRFFTQATKKDEKHLASLAALSNSLIFANGRGLISAEETERTGLGASEAALAIDGRSLSAHAAHALIEWVFADRHDRGERELRDVLEQSPLHFAATQFLAFSLMRDGRVSEAIQIFQGFLEHRSDTAMFRWWLAYALFLERKVESALREAKNCVELFPNSEIALAQLCCIAAYSGDHKLALETGNRLSTITNNGSLLALEAYGLAQSGEKYRAQELLDYILAFNREDVIYSALVPALIALGKPSDALNCLEQAQRRREMWVPLLLIDARLDSIRYSPRFTRVRSSYPRLNIEAAMGRRPVQSASLSAIRANAMPHS